MSEPRTLMDSERQLLGLFTHRSFRRGTFKLASGATSDYYIDGRMTAICSEGAFLIGQVLFDRLRDVAFDAIGGLAVGAVPMTTSAVMAYRLNGRSLEGFWVRDTAKDHGMKKRVEGGLKPGSRVAIVDDVFTSGSSGLKAVQAVREELGCEVVMVLALVDRLQGAAELFAENGVENYQSIFTIRDFL